MRQPTCYVLSADNSHMACIDFFQEAISYYATLALETTHWTRHESRLNREFGRKRFGDEGYAMEELVAAWRGLPVRRSRPDAGR